MPPGRAAAASQAAIGIWTARENGSYRAVAMCHQPGLKMPVPVMLLSAKSSPREKGGPTNDLLRVSLCGVTNGAFTRIAAAQESKSAFRSAHKATGHDCLRCVERVSPKPYKSPALP